VQPVSEAAAEKPAAKETGGPATAPSDRPHRQRPPSLRPPGRPRPPTAAGETAGAAVTAPRPTGEREAPKADGPRPTRKRPPFAPARPPGRPRRVRFEDEEPDGAEEEAFEEEGIPVDAGDDDSETLPLGAAIPSAIRRRKKRRPTGAAPVAARRKKKVKKRRRDAVVRPSPPLEKTDPLGAYLAGQMVPCPVGCGGFSEVVRVGTLENGSGEVWFECLSCAQRKQFVLNKASRAETAEVARAEEEGREPLCPRHSVHVGLRRRGRQFVCPACGVMYSP
jgi:hypothetical protein